MPKLLTILFCFISFSFFLQAQKTQKDLSPEKPIIKKGTLYNTNNSVMKFSELQFLNDTVVFIDSNGRVVKEPLINIERIDKHTASVGKGALMGGISGLVAGLVTGSIVYSEHSFLQWLVDEINGEEVEQSIKKEEIPYMAGGLLIGAGIGALVGATGKKEKTVYRRNPNVTVFPDFTVLPGADPAFGVHFKIRF